jgi:lantibiotic modifying enzyme
MDESLLNILDDIYEQIENNNSSISLMGGGPGITLFQLYYLKHIRNSDLTERVITNIRELSEKAIDYNNYPSFCGGQAGINWFFALLFKEGYLKRKDYKILTSSDSMLKIAAKNYLAADVYDFLHGGLGLAYYLLYKPKKESRSFFNEFLDKLTLLMEKGNPVLFHYDFELQALNPNIVNPSLSHGLSSVLKFCIECYKNNICKIKSKHLAKGIVDFLMNTLNKDKSYSYFTFVYDNSNNEKSNSRLAWCYGDLSIAYILHQYGVLFVDENVIHQSLEIFHHSSKRRSDDNSGVTDAGFCHGTAGVAYIFYKIWHVTKDPIFKDTAEFWYRKTLDYSFYKDGIAGFKRYNHVQKVWVNDSGLLEGVAGIGLSIIGFLFDDYTWDYCFMLN